MSSSFALRPTVRVLSDRSQASLGGRLRPNACRRTNISKSVGEGTRRLSTASLALLYSLLGQIAANFALDPASYVRKHISYFGSA